MATPTIERTETRPIANSLLARARELAPLIRSEAAAAERAGRITAPVHEALVEGGLYRLVTEDIAGGADLSLPETMRILETIAEADGSTAWVTMASCALPAMSAFLTEEGVAKLIGDPKAVTSSSVAGMGKAEVSEGGYLISGRWPFVSGCTGSTSVAVICMVHDGDTPRMTEEGPTVIFAVIPVDQLQLIENWETTGLRATGSHDVAVEALFVPDERIVDFGRMPRMGLSPVHYMNVEAAANVASASVATGIAQAAVSAFAEMAPHKPQQAGGTLADRPISKIAIARAEARLSQARGYLYETVETMWEEILAGQMPDEAWVARTSIAATTTVEACIEVVSSLYRAAGASAVRTSNPLDRCLRDIYTLGGHVMVQQENLVIHGGILFAH